MIKKAKYLRPDGSDASQITSTQLIHQWVHFLQSNGHKIIDASRGYPSYRADKPAIKAIKKVINNLSKKTFPYGTNSNGEENYLQIAKQGFKKEYGIDFSEKEIVLTVGGQFGLATAFYAVQKKYEDGVIIAIKPWYLNHLELAKTTYGFIYGKPPKHELFSFLELNSSNQYKITAKEFAKVVSGKKINAFLFCNPMNPLSKVISKEEWMEILPILEKHKTVPIILDEAFAEIDFSLKFDFSLLKIAPHLKNRTFLFRSGTKALGLSGERLAVNTIPPQYLSDITYLQSRLIGNPPLSAQAGMANALKFMSKKSKGKISNYYKKNAYYLYENLKGKGLLLDDNFRPEGGFYTLLRLDFLLGKKFPTSEFKFSSKEQKAIENDFDIVFSLMLGVGAFKEGLALIPGSCFGYDEKLGIVRVSFSPNFGQIKKIVDYLLKLTQV